MWIYYRWSRSGSWTNHHWATSPQGRAWGDLLLVLPVLPSTMRPSRCLQGISHLIYWELRSVIGMCWRTVWLLKQYGRKRESEASCKSVMLLDWALQLHSGTTSQDWTPRETRLTLRSICLEVDASWGWLKLGWTPGSRMSEWNCLGYSAPLYYSWTASNLPCTSLSYLEILADIGCLGRDCAWNGLLLLCFYFTSEYCILSQATDRYALPNIVFHLTSRSAD